MFVSVLVVDVAVNAISFLFTTRNIDDSEFSCWCSGRRLECKRSRVQNTVFLLSVLFSFCLLFFYLVSSFRVNFRLD